MSRGAEQRRARRGARAGVMLLLACSCLWAAGCRPVVAWFGRDPGRVTLVEVLDRRGRQRVVVDQVEGPWYDAVGVASLVFTEDGHTAYPAQLGARWHVVHDGRSGPAFAGIGDVVLQADGTRVMYAAEIAEGEWTVVVDGHEAGRWSALASGSLRLGGRGADVRWGFLAYRGEGLYAVVDGHEAGPFSFASAPILGATHSAFAAVDEGRARVYVDGVAGPAFAQVRDLQLVGDQVGYLGHGDAGSVMVLGGTPSEPHPNLRHLVLDERGRWLVIRADTQATSSPESLLVGPFPAGDEPAVVAQRWPSVRSLSFARFLEDGRVLFSGERDGVHNVYVDGQPEAGFDGIWTLASRGDHYAYVATDGGAQRVVVDGGLLARETARVDSLELSASGACAYHTLRSFEDDELVDVVVTPTRVWPAPGFVEGSLACLDDSSHCVHLAAGADGLRVVVDGRTALPFDLEEVVASVARSASRPTLGDDSWLRRWLLGELRWHLATQRASSAR